MLRRAGYAEGQVDARRDRPAGLPDLARARRPPHLDERSRDGHGRTHSLGEPLQAREPLGASDAAVFRRVTLPLILPGVASGWLLAFITSFDEVTMTVFVATPATMTLPVRMFLYIQDNIDPLVTSVSAVVIVLTAIFMLLIEWLYGLERLFAGPGRHAENP